jgi:V/A-type H+-transporting ATPase subunit G/H
MSVDILKDITAVEAQAEQIEAQAAQKARDMVASARREASEIKAKALEEAEKEAGNVLKAYEEKARQEISRNDLLIKEQCDDIRKNSQARMDKAVDFIVGRIVEP